MTDKLRDIGFQQSQIDECIFYHNDIIFIVYVGHGSFFGNFDITLMLIIRKLKKEGLNIKDQGHPADYTGVNIKSNHDGTYEFTQLTLVDTIIDDVDIVNSYTKPVPAKVSLQLHTFHDSLKFMGTSTIAELPDILYAICQAAKYSANPRLEHGKSIVFIVKYLNATHPIRINFKPNASNNADFARIWNKEFTATPGAATSRSGCISQVALSMTEAEYISMSMALCDINPLMELIKEMREHKFAIINTQPYIYCKIFEDNSSEL
ncbi:hypothetical protein ACHAW6_006168 [Cyclotella cf. meneghiniana]